MAGKLEGRLALVTGASRGIGRAIALRYAQEGADLILVARTTGALEELDDEVRALGRNATLVPHDLRKEPEKLDSLGAAIHDRWGKLDVLVGNAAMLGTLGPLAHCRPDIFEETMTVNVMANWRLIRSLDPLLRTSEAGRAIFVTSGVTQGVFPYWGPYAASKAALETLVKTYAAEQGKTNVKANLVDPGVVRTRMRATAFPGEDPTQHPEPEAITDIFVELAEASCERNGEVVAAY